MCEISKLPAIVKAVLEMNLSGHQLSGKGHTLVVYFHFPWRTFLNTNQSHLQLPLWLIPKNLISRGLFSWRKYSTICFGIFTFNFQVSKDLPFPVAVQSNFSLFGIYSRQIFPVAWKWPFKLSFHFLKSILILFHWCVNKMLFI